MGLTFTYPTTVTPKSPDLQISFINPAQSFSFDGDKEVTEQRVRVEKCEACLLPLARYPRAKLEVNLAEHKGTEGINYWDQCPMGEAERLIHPDTRLVIWAQIPEELGGGEQTREYLFDGYPRVQTLRWSDTFYTLQITCISLLEQMRKEKKAKIYGRYMVPNFAPVQTQVSHVEALPCVFNKGGLPNRHKDLWTPEGADEACAVFTYDGDPEACYWTWADVLSYLLTFYWRIPFGAAYPLSFQQGIDMIQAVGLLGRATPATVVEVGEPSFGTVVATKAEELVSQGLSLPDALLHWARLSGCCFQQYTRTNGSSFVTEVLFSANGEGGPWQDYGIDGERTIRRDSAGDVVADPAPLFLQKKGTTNTGLRPIEILLANDVSQGELITDVANVVSSVSVVPGKPEMYEVTIGKGTPTTNCLKPGWKPDTLFGDNLASATDKVAQIVQIAASEAGADLTGDALTMFKRYVRGPDVSSYSPYVQVGRFWILGETDEFSGTDYGRSALQAFWSATKYNEPFDFHVNCSVPKSLNRANNLREFKWYPRRRRFLPLLSRRPETSSSQKTPPVILCSFDSGTTWHEYPGAARIDEDRCAIWLSDANLAKVVQPKVTGSTQPISVWEAIVKGVFRLAITCCVEGDTLMIVNSDASAPLSSMSQHENLHTYDDFLYESRTGANSELKAATGWSGTNRDDTQHARTLANRYVAVSQRKALSFSPIIPWLSKDWMPGDLCTGVQPAGIDFSGIRGETARYPQVIETIWNNSENGQITELVFDDRRSKPKEDA